ncbi:E3 ubiquitin-protein ligase ARIH2-like [Sardina pilchardus]|uniref:E3 ubiquitin-protein ligase ARIH2-like n=1 Tax=Sardina pilchardus TaxID=27697 RepID=UPI002E1047E4
MGAGKSTPKEDQNVATTQPNKREVRPTEGNRLAGQSSGSVYQLPHLCATCLSPWQGPPGVLGRCANKRCAVVGTLLTCGLVTDPTSKVKGCPEFRACPKCCSLLMHSCGCKYVICSQCSHTFCYICLSDSEECRKDKDLYWSLTCSKPTAGRQWFTGPF